MPTSSTTADRTAGPSHRARSTGPRLAFYGGKGGVGKTTLAAARGVAEARAGRRVLVVSTDPAHSLGDALGLPLGSRATTVTPAGGRGSLAAMELNGPRAFARWLRTNRQALGDVLEHGTWLDRSDVDALLQLPIPGLDELMALVEIGRLAATSACDLMIVDTAPTGHTLRLLGAPDAVSALARLLDDLQDEHRIIRARFGRAGRAEAADRLIETLGGQATDAGALLTRGSRSAFHLVTLPEALAVEETGDALAALGRAHIPVAEIVVNRVTPPGPRCPRCSPRRAAEASALDDLRRLARGVPVRRLAARPVEPRGVAALLPIGRELIASRGRTVATKNDRAARGRDERRATENDEYGASKDAPLFPALVGARLLMFGGKGGVGKTTCAAAAAMRLAAADPARRVLLLSTDPAHSLGDVLGVRIGDEAIRVKGAPANLRARELDAQRALAARRSSIESAVASIASTSASDAARGVNELLDLAPPGIDELVGIISVVESLGLEDAGSSAYDLVVCDTAPTGHALRLLELPAAAREWVQTLLRVLLKYREIVRPGRLARELVELSQAIRRLQALFRNPSDARFIVVTRAAEVPRLETERLLRQLKRLRISAPAVVVNAATLDAGACPSCQAAAAGERPIIARLAGQASRRPSACAIILTPLVAPPPRGVPSLVAWAGTWRDR